MRPHRINGSGQIVGCYYDSVIGGPGAFVVAALRDFRRRHPQEAHRRDRRE
jgi:hypothetical protein